MYQKLTPLVIIKTLFFCILISNLSISEVFSDSLQQKISVKNVSSGKKSNRILKKSGSIILSVQRALAKNLPLKHIRIYLVRLLVLCFSIVIIISTIMFYRQKMEKNRFMTTTRLSIMDKEVQRACRYIELNFALTDLSIEALCNELVTGTAFLEALFERELGMSVDDFIKQVRVNHARIILNKDPSVAMEQVAIQTGFLENHEFSKAFESIVGANFVTYKKSLLSNLIS